MKKLLTTIVVLTMAFSFLPKAEADDSAHLDLTVSFDLPLKIWSDPEGPFKVTETKALEFKVIAEDKDTLDVDLTVGELPKGAEFVLVDDPSLLPSPGPRKEGIFKWTPRIGQAQDTPYLVVFYATNAEGEAVKLPVEITVLEAVISIELVGPKGQPISTWEMQRVKLGELRDNTYEGSDSSMHNVRNSGTVDVVAAIRYGEMPIILPPSIQPGDAQGPDTFITGLGRVNEYTVLPPSKSLKIGDIKVGDTKPLWLTYGAPTELSEGLTGHETPYDVIAYLPISDPSN